MLAMSVGPTDWLLFIRDTTSGHRVLLDTVPQKIIWSELGRPGWWTRPPEAAVCLVRAEGMTCLTSDLPLRRS